jgi:hypothetical protein
MLCQSLEKKKKKEKKNKKKKKFENLIRNLAATTKKTS